MKRFLLILAILSVSSAYGQAWSGVLAPARATSEWATAGLPATLPDGETAPNPWTPPTRTSQCGSTIMGGASISTVQTAVNGCANAGYVLLSGTFNWSSGVLDMANINEVSLRGTGAGGGTTINLSGSASIQIGDANGAGSATIASFPDSTHFTFSSSSGVTLTNGNLVLLTQCNTGLSGSGCSTGTQTDNGGVFVCSGSAACNQQVGGGSSLSAQLQTVLVTNISGAGPYTTTFTPALLMPNWSTSNTATAAWQNAPHNGVGIGIEDMTINITTSQNPAFSMNNGYASWFKGLRIVGNNGNNGLKSLGSLNCLIANNYIHYEIPSAIDGNDGLNMLLNNDTAMLVLNNITDTGDVGEYDAENGDVVAYNYGRDGNTTYIQDAFFGHDFSPTFNLIESNEWATTYDDNTWTSHDFDTWFRNHALTTDPPYTYTSNNGLPRGILVDSFARFENLIGNVVGTNTTLTPHYESTVSVPYSFGYEFGFYANNLPSDTLTQTTAMLWGNCDVVNAGCRFVSGEVPTTLSGAAAPYENSVPSSMALPASFFLSTTAHPSGGTGLSWWKVCTSWATFPTSCSGTQTQPFPANGPDVAGGSYVLGHAYDIPAAIADHTLPVDMSYQASHSITGSSWAGGTETLTVSTLPNLDHLMGRFQISGGACATSGAGTSTGAEVLITASTSTTVSYALASNPGSCSGGAFLFPDVREFDERVYQADTSGTPAPAPQSFVWNGSSTKSQSVTLTGSTTVPVKLTGTTSASYSVPIIATANGKSIGSLTATGSVSVPESLGGSVTVPETLTGNVTVTSNLTCTCNLVSNVLSCSCTAK